MTDSRGISITMALTILIICCALAGAAVVLTRTGLIGGSKPADENEKAERTVENRQPALDTSPEARPKTLAGTQSPAASPDRESANRVVSIPSRPSADAPSRKRDRTARSTPRRTTGYKDAPTRETPPDATRWEEEKDYGTPMDPDRLASILDNPIPGFEPVDEPPVVNGPSVEQDFDPEPGDDTGSTPGNGTDDPPRVNIKLTDCAIEPRPCRKLDMARRYIDPLQEMVGGETGPDGTSMFKTTAGGHKGYGLCKASGECNYLFNANGMAVELTSSFRLMQSQLEDILGSL